MHLSEEKNLLDDQEQSAEYLNKRIEFLQSQIIELKATIAYLEQVVRSSSF